MLVKATEIRYNNGDLDVATAVARLVNAGQMSDEAVATVATWKVNQHAQPREVAASQLCQWYGQNLISLEEYERRLIQLRWAKPDVERIIAGCRIGIAAKAAAKLPKTKRSVSATKTHIVIPAGKPDTAKVTETVTTSESMDDPNNGN